MPELTTEELEAKKEEELLSSQNEEKVTSPTSTSLQKDQLTDAQKLKIFELQTKTVRDQGARITQIQREFDEFKAKEEEKELPTQEESAKKFYADPVSVMREELEKAIAPLNAFKDRFESDSEYDRIKRGLKANPNYSKHLSDPQFEAVIDELVADGQRLGTKVNEDIVAAAIKHTIGSLVTGDIVFDSVTETKDKKEEDKVIPPYLQPSSPPQKSRDKREQLRDLTENEERLRRERGQTKEEYLKWLEVDSNDVIDSKIGVATEEKK